MNISDYCLYYKVTSDPVKVTRLKLGDRVGCLCICMHIHLLHFEGSTNRLQYAIKLMFLSNTYVCAS